MFLNLGSIPPATGPTGQRMASPVGPPVGSVAGGPTTQIRPPQWSGETHPALAQVIKILFLVLQKKRCFFRNKFVFCDGALS